MTEQAERKAIMAAALLGALVLQATALMAQAVLAGLALGGAPALGAHWAVGGASLLLALVQVGAALLLWRSRRAPAWLFAANLLFLAADGAQAAAGRAHAFAVHLPLGVALFAAAAGLSIWSWDLMRTGVRSPPAWAKAAA
jgi:hypothetical protein